MIPTAKKPMYIALGIITVILALVFFYIAKEQIITGYIAHIIFGGPELKDPSLVLNLTFDDSNDPWKDYSMYNHVFSAQGNVNWVDRNFCKWYGCADFTAASAYLNSSAKWENMTGIALKWWVYHNSKPSGSSSQFYFQIGEGSTLKSMQDGGYGPSPNFVAENGKVDGSAGESSIPQDGSWYFYFIQYNPIDGRLYVWQNDKLILNSSENFGNLNHAIGDIIKIGIGLYNIDLDGYLDEFTVWNRGNFTSEEVLEFYNSQKLGTPPNLDLYVKEIKYELPYDWNDDRNRLIVGGDMDVIFTIANAGTKSSSNFNYEFKLDENSICSGRTSLSSKSETDIICTWPTSYGFHKGFMTLDTSNEASEDNENNNAQRVYIPFLDRPFIYFDLIEWENTLKPFAQDSSNGVAFDSYGWIRSFLPEDFNNAWYGDNVDPRGKKGRENAVGCLVNDYISPTGKPMCERSINHLKGWANRTITTYSNVQAIHELIHVGVIYDTVFPILTQEENSLISKQLSNICQQLTNLKNTRPDLDDDSEITGGNGFGFGSGMAGFCYSILGSYSENPTLIQELDQQYWGKNIPDEWMDREVRYLRSFKDDPWSKYQERISYKWYSQFHLVENWLFEKRFGLNNLKEYQNAFCSMAREAITEVLDFNFNGNNLRNNGNQKLRTVQAGDSYSYENIGSGSFIDFGILTSYGILCDDIDTKKSILWLRDYAHEQGDGQNGYVDSYLYKQLYDQANQLPKSPEGIFPKVIFDNANDILTIRTNYTYVDDNVIQVDGGEEKGGGHSQAQGYYLYALGEPFLDYEQVPFEDDTRMDTWKNGVSLQNTTQSIEGTGGIFNSKCGDAGLNQYYGMQSCTTPKYPQDYPNNRHFPLQYGGDLEDYIGTKDANFAGVYVWRPYKNADDVKEYFVKFGELLAKRTVVSSVTQGNGIYHNFINIFNEFTETRNGNDLTFKRNGKNLDINVIHTSQPLTLGGGDSGIAYCFSKTSCSGSNRGLGTYRRTYLHTPEDNLDLILSHHWYLDGQKQNIKAIKGNDKGLQQGNNVIIFDTNNDGIVSYNNKETDGWALAFNNNEIGAFNATYIKAGAVRLLNADDALSVHIKRDSDKITLTVNTMDRNNYIDYPKKIRVTVDARELTYNKNFKITKNDNEDIQVISELRTKVTFYVESEQNSDYYAITGSSSNKNKPNNKTKKLPKREKFNGRTTNFESILNIEEADDVVLEIIDHGRILFPGKINMSDLDLDKYVEINQNHISVNSKFLKRLNISAVLFLYDLPFKNPRILRDGEVCPSSLCKIISRVGNNLTFSVNHFTTYTAEETPAESSSQESEEGGNGGKSGSGFAVKCTEEWECSEWSSCSKDEIQTRVCEDRNKCSTARDKPDIARICIYAGEIEIKSEEEKSGKDEIEVVRVEKNLKVPIIQDKRKGVNISIIATLALFAVMMLITYRYKKSH